jgi:dTDP-4-amino-4,6-dideoxygalactose transaminase
MNKSKIAYNINYPKPIPLLPAFSYQNNREKDYTNSVANANQILSIPIYPELPTEMQTRVIQTLLACEPKGNS